MGARNCSISDATRAISQRAGIAESLQWRAMPIEPVIVADAEVMNGTPCFRGTRVPFKNLMDYLEAGHSLGEFLNQFPTVTREMAIQALEEAKESLLARIA